MKKQQHDGKCCDLPKGSIDLLCWYRKPTFADKHPKLAAMMKVFGEMK